MILYRLRCARGHEFESWFRSSGDYDRLSGAGRIACAICGDTTVTKAPMAPNVAAGNADKEKEKGLAQAGASPRTPPVEKLIRAIRKAVEEKADYVGPRFAREARAIHEGAAPNRPIWGEATREEARALAEEGLPVTPLPFIPKKKTH